ncbi:hypothetical protein SynBIOSE41_00819 [Synechococcus sp. BIOS-E4-1]|nr:hypothetical protein SynBIOSE41_00819 [Synechococcus sp. BIOS-E4-1]
MLADYVTSISGNDLFKIIFDHLSDTEYERFASNFYEDDEYTSACFD